MTTHGDENGVRFHAKRHACTAVLRNWMLWVFMGTFVGLFVTLELLVESGAVAPHTAATKAAGIAVGVAGLAVAGFVALRAVHLELRIDLASNRATVVNLWRTIEVPGNSIRGAEVGTYASADLTFGRDSYDCLILEVESGTTTARVKNLSTIRACGDERLLVAIRDLCTRNAVSLLEPQKTALLSARGDGVGVDEAVAMGPVSYLATVEFGLAHDGYQVTAVDRYLETLRSKLSGAAGHLADPDQVEQHSFPTSLRGYRREDVDRYLQAVAGEMRTGPS